MPKTGLRNVADVYLKTLKNQTNGDRDLKHGLKWLVGCLLIDLGGGNMLTHLKILVWDAYNFEKMPKKGVVECRGRVFEVL